MARLLRETTWRGWTAGDVFRVAGMRGKRFRFRAHVTNFENGSTYVEASDVTDGSFRAFDPAKKLVKDRRHASRPHPAP